MKLNSIKFIALITVTLFAANPAYAGPDGSPFEGLYLGVSLVKNTFDSTATYEENVSNDFPSNFTAITDSSSSNSYGGGVLAGYGLNYGLLYFGAEAAFIVDKGSSTYSDGTNTVRVAKSNTLDVNGRLGFTVSNKALIFGLIGYSGISLKSKGVNENGQDVRNLNTRSTGLKFGGGVEFLVMENIAIRAEYTRTTGNDILYRDGSDQFTFKPKTSRIMISAILHMY
ncbi:MAG: outer membrane beta-barrel protein [Emcibacteraceae bacterium]|nr:outer membrane beta-barrel protein [Emcibacteraceae bacterium]MDG1995009.1 outer membrane beta-barrel protein [Emcibacteraceae bacterium]